MFSKSEVDTSMHYHQHDIVEVINNGPWNFRLLSLVTLADPTSIVAIQGEFDVELSS